MKRILAIVVIPVLGLILVVYLVYYNIRHTIFTTLYELRRAHRLRKLRRDIGKSVPVLKPCNTLRGCDDPSCPECGSLDNDHPYHWI